MEELVERARTGDHAAYTDIVTMTVDRLHATAHLMTRDRVLAEDAVQEAFLRAWRDLPTLRDVRRYHAWMRRILIRSCLDQLRNRPRHEVSLHPWQSARHVADESFQVDHRDEIAWAFGRISPNHRAVIALAHYDDLTTTEIADALDIPVGTAKSRLHHALRALHAAIDAGRRSPVGQRGEPT
jgi:RNA polymerase sigma-70 factor, ECF subfamily